MNSITNICIKSWNNIPEILEKPFTLSRSELKKTMFELSIANYRTLQLLCFKHLVAKCLVSAYCDDVMMKGGISQKISN